MKRWLCVLGLALLVGCDKNTATPVAADAPPAVKTPVATPSPEPELIRGLPKYTQKAVVDLNTSKGLIVLEVDGVNAPVSAGNFLDLVKRNFYDGLTFHRVVPGFVIQGGDPLGNGEGGFKDPLTGKERTIPLEIKLEDAKEPLYGKTLDPNLGNLPPVLKHSKGALAWARSNDPNSASSQFYITLADTSFLNGKYAVFGKVLKGQEVVEKIVQGDKILKATIEAQP